MLRHQLSILRRKAPRPTRLTKADRLAFIWLYRLCPAAADAVTIIRPETLIGRLPAWPSPHRAAECAGFPVLPEKIPAPGSSIPCSRIRGSFHQELDMRLLFLAARAYGPGYQ